MHHSRFSHGFIALILLAAFAATGSAIVMALWNAIITPVCGFLTITFWQALGLLTLGLTLSGGMIVAIAMLAHAFNHHHAANRDELYRKWHSMTDEQRREFIASRGFSAHRRN